MIGKSISKYYSLPQQEDILFLRWSRKIHPDVPYISAIHEDRPMLKTPDELQTSKARYARKKVIFLVRDPRDVIVSSYFEMNKRAQIFGNNPYEKRSADFDGGLKEFISRKQGGFDTILRYYNVWAENKHIPKAFLLIRYEDMRANPQYTLRQTVDFLGLSNIGDEILRESVEYASFENMRNMEATGRFSSGILNPANSEDKSSYKTRKGKIGGFVDYLSESEIEELNLKMHKLNRFYGYAP
jgi:hypothetical protein